MNMNDPIVTQRIQQLLGSPELQPLVRSLDRRLGKQPDIEGSVTLSKVAPETIDTVCGLLGRPPSQGNRLTVRLSELNSVVHAATGVDLTKALTVLLGRPPRHPAHADRETRRRWERARQNWIATAKDSSPHVLQLLQEYPRTADLRRLSGDDQESALDMLDHLRRCLMRLPLDPPMPLPIFAAEMTGDAHGLDTGRPLQRWLGEAIERLFVEGQTDASARDNFGRVGIVRDELSSTVLVLNLRPMRGNLLADFLNESASMGEPTRLTFRQLRHHPLKFTDDHAVVSVCENPSIMAIAADSLADQCGPMICVEGFASHAAIMLIDQIAESNTVMRYHGDFDASGLQIAHQMIVGKKMKPWRMNASDYERVLTKTNLDLPATQTIIETPWDVSLQQSLLSYRKCVLEEMVADDLTEDLCLSPRTDSLSLNTLR